jgi:hypothetical protein
MFARPWDTMGVRPAEPEFRQAIFGTFGLVSFYVDDRVEVVRVYDVTWTRLMRRIGDNPGDSYPASTNLPSACLSAGHFVPSSVINEQVMAMITVPLACLERGRSWPRAAIVFPVCRRS